MNILNIALFGISLNNLSKKEKTFIIDIKK